MTAAEKVQHVYANPFVQCHPGNSLCVPAEGRCKVCGEAKDHPLHFDGDEGGR